MRFPELSRYSEGCLLTFSAALLVSAATIYVTSVNGGYLGGYQVVDWSQQLEGLHEKKSGVTARKSPTYEGHEMPTHLPIVSVIALYMGTYSSDLIIESHVHFLLFYQIFPTAMLLIVLPVR